jgi:hypothetical protein
VPILKPDEKIEQEFEMVDFDIKNVASKVFKGKSKMYITNKAIYLISNENILDDIKGI